MANGIYTVGGAVQAYSGLYIERSADRELLDLCRQGVFAYVLTARQMGKSSLMVSTAERLAQDGVRSVIVDLPVADDHQVEMILQDGKQHGGRIVGVPWETARIEERDGLYLTRRMSSERFRQISGERLAHEIVHEAILTQWR